MELLETDLRERLLEESDEYRRLAAEHRRYERQLEQIANRRPFTQRDWFEESVLKKRKLLVKDRMEALVKLQSAGRAAARR